MPEGQRVEDVSTSYYESELHPRHPSTEYNQHKPRWVSNHQLTTMHALDYSTHTHLSFGHPTDTGGALVVHVLPRTQVSSQSKLEWRRKTYPCLNAT